MRYKTFIAVNLSLLAWAGIQTASAQQPSQVGVVTNSIDATLGQTPVSNGSTIFSGDLLKTAAEGRLQVQSGTMQFVFEPNSSARIFKSGDRVIVELERGAVSYSAKGVGENLTLFAQDVKFVPKTSELAVGQITIASRCELRASAQRSTLAATSGKESHIIETNKTYNVLSDIGVDYNDSWKPVLREYPDYPREADYHHSHNHVACAPGVWQNAKGPIQAGAPGHFVLILGVAAGVATTIIAIKAFESPDKP